MTPEIIFLENAIQSLGKDIDTLIERVKTPFTTSDEAILVTEELKSTRKEWAECVDLLNAFEEVGSVKCESKL